MCYTKESIMMLLKIYMAISETTCACASKKIRCVHKLLKIHQIMEMILHKELDKGKLMFRVHTLGVN